MIHDLSASAREYVLELDLPAGTRSAAAAAPQAIPVSDHQEAISLGAQLTEFSERVPTDAKAVIADSILLAQLAANKAASRSADLFAWYDKYIEVLQNLGWQGHDLEFQTQTIADRNASVHKAIIPVLTALLGPQVAVASIVLSVLNGLKEMDESTPWITLFDRSSQHASGAKFQIGYVDADADGHPDVALACFGIQAEQTITQVLFFKFTGQRAEVKKAAGRLTISLERLESAREVIANRVRPFIVDYVQNIEI